jgi:ATP-binding cassette subfamily B protein/ATP-binding cassette subfamily C protein
MLNLSFRLGLITLLILPVIAAAIFLFRYFDRLAYRKVRTRLAIINAFLAEHISGMSITQLFNQERRKREEFDGVNKNHFKSLMERSGVIAIFRPLLYLLYKIIYPYFWFGVNEIGTRTRFGELGPSSLIKNVLRP